MHTAHIEHIAREALGTSKVWVAEMPAHQAATPSPERCLLINVGPLALDLQDAATALGQCHALIHQLLDRLAAEPALLPCRVGISIFAEPGGQAFRALSGSAELTATSASPYPLTGLYSNIRAFRALMNQAETTGPAA